MVDSNASQVWLLHVFVGLGGVASCVWLWQFMVIQFVSGCVCGLESTEGEGGAHRAALEGAGPGEVRGGQGCRTGGRGESAMVTWVA